MTKFKTYKYLLASIAAISVMFGYTCGDKEKDVVISIYGPYYNEKILERFGLDSLSLNINSKNLFIAKIYNNSQDTIHIKSTKDQRIYPDSIWHHSYNPYAAFEKSWSITYYKPDSEELYLFEIPYGQSKSFWFSSYYDEYMDTLTMYFSCLRNRNKVTGVVKKLCENKKKPIIYYQLIQVDYDKEHVIQTGIETKITGPLTYEDTNQRLGTNIKYKIDSEEVFIFEVTNKRDENVYVEIWENFEMNIDTMYTFLPFTLTSKEYTWNEISNKKGSLPIDTIVIRPQESRKFWDRCDRIWPTTDSLVFCLKYRTDNYLILENRKYEVKKY